MEILGPLPLASVESRPHSHPLLRRIVKVDFRSRSFCQTVFLSSKALPLSYWAPRYDQLAILWPFCNLCRTNTAIQQAYRLLHLAQTHGILSEPENNLLRKIWSEVICISNKSLSYSVLTHKNHVRKIIRYHYFQNSKRHQRSMD